MSLGRFGLGLWPLLFRAETRSQKRLIQGRVPTADETRARAFFFIIIPAGEGRRGEAPLFRETLTPAINQRLAVPWANRGAHFLQIRGLKLANNPVEWVRWVSVFLNLIISSSKKRTDVSCLHIWLESLALKRNLQRLTGLFFQRIIHCYCGLLCTQFSQRRGKMYPVCNKKKKRKWKGQSSYPSCTTYICVPTAYQLEPHINIYTLFRWISFMRLQEHLTAVRKCPYLFSLFLASAIVWWNLCWLFTFGPQTRANTVKDRAKLGRPQGSTGCRFTLGIKNYKNWLTVLIVSLSSVIAAD